MSLKQILVCQNRTCRRQGSLKILSLFQEASVPNISIEGTGCLGQCGNGPIVVVLPEEIWYSHLHPDDVSIILQKHLQNGQSVETV